MTVTCSNGTTFPTFYIASRSAPQAGLLSLVCYDRMMMLDQDFDFSGFVGENEKDPFISHVVSAIVSQCGFSGGGSITVHGATTIPMDEIKGSTCRKILETLSAGGCGIWYCSNSNNLTFLPFGSNDTLVSSDLYSMIKVGLPKGPISRVVAVNSENGEVFDSLGGTSVSSTVRIESIFASSENIEGILSACRNYELHSFSCDKLLLDGNIEIGGLFTVEENDYTVLSYSLSFSPGGIFASISCPNLNESEFGYLAFAERAAKDAVQSGRTHKNVMISKYEGLTLVGR